MKNTYVTALILFILGIIVSIISWIPIFGLRTGYGALIIGYPLITIGIIIFIISWIFGKFKPTKK
jgi:hypothetical protein